MRKVGIVLAVIAMLAMAMVASGVAYACPGGDISQCSSVPPKY